MLLLSGLCRGDVSSGLNSAMESAFSLTFPVAPAANLKPAQHSTHHPSHALPCSSSEM